MKVSLVEDKSQPFWCFRPPRSLPSSLRQPAELLKCGCGLLGSLAPRLGQEDEDEDEAEETDAAIEEEGGGVAERLLQVSEGLGHDEPAEVGDQVGQGVRPTTGPL